jgi:hypothetical protein
MVGSLGKMVEFVVSKRSVLLKSGKLSLSMIV